MSINSCSIRYYGNLKELLDKRKKERRDFFFTGSPGIKDIVEADGIPHTEVSLVIVNGYSAGWDYRLKNGDYCAIYPCFDEIDIKSESLVLEPEYPRGRFIIDVHLGKLCRYLRMLGFDAAFNPEWKDPDIIDQSNSEFRIILTRDRGILKSGQTRYGCLIRSDNALEQLSQVLDRFSLYKNIYPLVRCLKCNGVIESVPVLSVAPDLQENTKKHYHEFFRCLSCGSIYWKGSHYENMKKMIERLFAVKL
jgi:hypothetical protein